MKLRRRITKSIILLCAVLACVLLIKTLVTVGEAKAKLSEIFLAQPVFAQQATAFPSDEAGISAYVNVGQSIDLSKAKSAMRGIQAEGDNYVIGIMELSGLPEEEFPHMYISSDGWILAYYSKFAPASRIMHWGKYGGGTINTNTLQDAISKTCTAVGVNFAQVREDMGYYHFKYPDATRMTVAVDTTEGKLDTFSYSIPSSLTLYEASYSHFSQRQHRLRDGEGQTINQTSGLDCHQLEDRYLVPDKVHVMELGWGSWSGGVAIVFIYR